MDPEGAVAAPELGPGRGPQPTAGGPGRGRGEAGCGSPSLCHKEQLQI